MSSPVVVPPEPPAPPGAPRPRPRDPSDVILAGFILISVGIVFYLERAGLLFGDEWPFFLVAVGAALLLEQGFRITILRPGSAPRQTRLIAGLVLVAAGLVFALQDTLAWPVLLVSAGILFIAYGLYRARTGQGAI